MSEFLNYLVIISSILSVGGNIFLILSILSNFETRNPFGSFIINLSIADLFSAAFVQSHVLLEKYNNEVNSSYFIFKALETSSRSLTLMFLIVLFFYLIFSLISQVTIEKYFLPEDTFINSFILWTLIGGVHLVYHKVKTKCKVYDDGFLVNDFFDLIFMVILSIQFLTAYYIRNKQKRNSSNNTDENVSRYENFGLTLHSSSGYTCYTDKSMKTWIKLQAILFIIFWLPYFITVLLIFNGINVHDFSTFAYLFGTTKGIAACIGTFIVYPDSQMILHKIREFVLTIRD